MPQPSAALATLRPDLAGAFEEFDLAASRAGFIGQKIFKPFTTVKKSGQFPRLPIEELLRNRPIDRSPGGRYNRDGWKFKMDTFSCTEKGHEGPVDDTEAEMFSDFFDAEMVTAERERDVVLRAMERRVAAICNDNGKFANAAAAAPWTTLATADPLTDVENAVQAIRDATGLTPNTIQLPWKAWRALRRTNQWKDFVASSGAGESTLVGRATLRMAADFFDLPNVLIGDGQQNVADEGQALDLDEIWDATKVWVGRVAVREQDIKEPCVGRTFYWQADGGMLNATIESYRDESVRSEIIRARHDVDEKELLLECGRIITGVTA